MKALLSRTPGGPETLELAEVPDPEPADVAKLPAFPASAR